VSRILFDVNIPRPLARLLTRHNVELADQLGWRELTNGDLLSAAEKAGFDLMLTADTNLRYQQNLSGRRISIIALSTNAWPIIRDNVQTIAEALDAAAPGYYADVSLPRSPLNRPPEPD
jgi:predicted nuclease of predicted toxin-antitoxin system